MNRLFVLGLLISALSAPALAGGAHSPGDPCAPVLQACSGFKKGDWKKGDGIMRDCVNPIMQGVTNVPGSTKSLPTVDPAVVSACKTKHPKFGQGKVGS